MGAVDGAAPTDLEESSFYTHNFHVKISLAKVFGADLKICTHSLKILTRPLHRDAYINKFTIRAAFCLRRYT